MAAALLCVGTLSISCGSDSGSPGSLNDFVSPGGVPGDYSSYCTQRGGYLVFTGQTPVCKISKDFTLQDFGSFPTQTPSSSGDAAPASYYNQFYVKPGDSLVFQGSGGWGFADGWDCDLEADLNGVGANPNEKVPPSFMGSVGGNAGFKIGSSKNLTFQQEGYFKFGFNVSYASNHCYKLTISKFRVQHCENSSGATITCP